ncbi:MAG: hypothetical protein WC683_02515 [bacterium]
MLGALLMNGRVQKYAKFAFGLRGSDVRDLDSYGIPVWSVVLASFVIGGYVTLRFAPNFLVGWVRPK